jgi:hypothetical protein
LRQTQFMDWRSSRPVWCAPGFCKYAFYLLFFAVAGILMAAIPNWRNDKQGYWMNGTLIAFADIPFVLFALAPGLIPWWPGLVGPLFWLIAFMFTTVARFSAHPRIAAGAPA